MRYITTGRVHPERAAVSFGPLGLKLSDNEKANIHCDASQLTVALDLEGNEDYVLARNIAEHLAQMIVSSLGYSLGTGYSVEIIQVITEVHGPTVFGVRPGKLEFEPYLPVFQRALELAGADIFFRLGLKDYCRALVDVPDCALYCYRAIEAIQASFAPSPERDGWKAMHAALGTERGAIDTKVKSFADPIRHGNWIGAKVTNSKQRFEMLELTKDILHRYLQLKRA